VPRPEIIPSVHSPKPLKVAWFSYFPIEWLPDLPPELNGVPRMHPATWQRVFWEQLRERPGLELDIFAVRSHFARTISFQRGNTRFHCVKTPRGMRAASFYWLDTLLIARRLRSIRPDVVHAWGSEFGAGAIAARLGYPALVTMQGILSWLGSVFPLNRQMRIARRLEARALRRARVASAESNFAISYLKERYPNLHLLQIEHAPNPIFSRIIRRPQAVPLRFLCVSEFQYSKGADTIVQALDALGSSPERSNFEMVWIGSKDETFMRTLQKKVSRETWNRIAFRNKLTAEEVAAEFETATLMIHASRADNSPNAVKEAVVAGLPVICSDTGGIPDYVREGKNGLLFEPGNVDALAAQIGHALKDERFRRGRVDQTQLDWVRDYLSVETMTWKFLDGYQAAIQSMPRKGQSASP
jgi:glycosyltransferase involved in cell wall biosynthesis